ncbi:MAG: hypothetical protein ABH871_01990 [Pseudomonadota bacterium]
MKILKTHAWQLLGIIALLFVVAGCSDGELMSNVGPSITPPAPLVISFFADPTTINSGQSTTISWEVAGADTVQITAVESATGTPVNFNVETSELSGTAPAVLTATTDFTLTATKSTQSLETEGEPAAQMTKSGQIQFGPEGGGEGDGSAPAPEPAISTISQTITVTVIDGGNLTADIEADKPLVDAGEQTVIRWTVSPTENVSVQVVAENTGEQFAVTDQCEGSITDILGKPPVDPTPTVGCAVVAPEVKTNYTVTATDSFGNEATASAIVDVGESDVTANIMAAKDESSAPEDNLLQVDSFNKPVIISWKAEPSTAKVTITASPSVTVTSDAPCELPVDAENATQGSTKCQVSGETEFTITATVGSKSDTDKVAIVSVGGAAGLIVADQWAFETEDVTLDMKLTAKSNTSAVARVLVNNKDIESTALDALKIGQLAQVLVKDVKAPHVKVQILDQNDEEVFSTDTVQVVNLVVNELAADEVAMTSLIFDSSNGKRYSGVMLDGYHDGNGRIYKDGGAHEFNFGKAIKSMYGMDKLWNDAFFNNLKTYPAVVALKEGSSTEVYAGVTGAVMRSKDGGNKWENIMVTRRRALEDYPEGDTGHPTCGRAANGAQKTQANGPAEFVGDFISLNQICDIIAQKDGRVIVATDFGVMVEKNINDSNIAWVGVPAEGVDPVKLGALTFGHVVNDLLEVDGNIYAATDKKVYVSDSSQGGIGWAEFGGGALPPLTNIWTLAYDERNQKIYAGTEDGLYATSKDAADWVPLTLTEPVISLAIDAYSPLTKMTILAGTPNGAQISRDSGATWHELELEGGSQPISAMAMHAEQDGNVIRYGIAMGSDQGELFQEMAVGAQTITEEPETGLEHFHLIPQIVKK